jgi:hypothetical protein
MFLEKSMKFMFNVARLPEGSLALQEQIDSASCRLFDKLEKFDVKALDISDYNKRYFGEGLRDLTAWLQLRSYMLLWCLFKNTKPLSDTVFVDYGGGSGMLALLAKELGIGTVIYNDIYDVSCYDARCIANAIGNEIDYYVHGDIDALISFLRKNSMFCDAIASYDVIEHIYDVGDFLGKLHCISDGPLAAFMSSGANMLNPRQNRLLMKAQREIEYKDRDTKWGKKPTDCLQSHLKVRRKMVSKYLQEYQKEMTDAQIELFAKNTRGMIEKDIRKCLDEYFQTGKVPEEPSHPTNTCDPYNGNWAEHLMDPYSLASILYDTGFEVEILSGYYGSVSHLAKRIIGQCLNVPIYLFKKQGIRLAPFFSLYGLRNY